MITKDLNMFRFATDKFIWYIDVADQFGIICITRRTRSKKGRDGLIPIKQISFKGNLNEALGQAFLYVIKHSKRDTWDANDNVLY